MFPLAIQAACRIARRQCLAANPVTFPPGRARLATRPALTGLALLVMTIGIVVVAFMAAIVF